MNTTSVRNFRRGLLLCGLGMAMAAGAAEQTGTDAFELSEVTITATKTATNLQDTPMTVTAIGGDDIQQSGRTTLTQILQDVPGVQANTAGNFGQYYWIRGIGSSPTFGQDTAVTTSVNGVFLQMSQSNRSAFFDIERVEVARGPQSTLTGRNSLGGAVSVITVEPKREFEAEGTIGAGNLGLFNAQGVVNVPLGSNMAVRASLSTEKRDGLLSNGSSDSDQSSGRLRWLIQPNDDVKLIVSAERAKTGGRGIGSADPGYFVPSQTSQFGLGRYCRNVTECAAAYTSTGLPTAAFNNLPFVTDPYRTLAPSSPYSRAYEADTFYADLNWKLGPVNLFVQPTYMKSDAVDHNAIFSPAQYILWAERVVRLAPTMPVSQQEQIATGLATGLNWNHLAQKQKTLEVKLSSQDDARIKWLGGFYYFENSEQVRTSITIMGVVGAFTAGAPTAYCTPTCTATAIPLNAVATVPTIGSNAAFDGVLTTFRPGVDPLRKTTDMSVYGQLVLPLRDALNLTLGARYTKEKKTRAAEDRTQLPRSYFIDNNGPATGAIQYVYTLNEVDRTWNLFDYRATLDYKFTPDNMVYASISTGFRGGSFQNVGTATHQLVGGVQTPLATPVPLLPGFSNTYDPERLTSYEIGTRNEFMDHRMRVNASAYYYDYRDYQYGYQAFPFANIDPDAPIAYTANVGKAKTYGLDLETSFLLSPADQLSINVAYIKSELGQLTLPGGSAGSIADANSLKGAPLRRSPEWSGGPRYSHRFRLGALGMLTASADLRYESQSYVNNVAVASVFISNRFIQQEAYSRSNATLAFDSADGKYNVTAFVRNLTDEVTIGTISPTSFNAAAANQVQAQTWDPSEPRTYGVTLSARF